MKRSKIRFKFASKAKVIIILIISSIFFSCIAIYFNLLQSSRVPAFFTKALLILCLLLFCIIVALIIFLLYRLALLEIVMECFDKKESVTQSVLIESQFFCSKDILNFSTELYLLEKKESSMHSIVMHSEFDAMQSLINPHFLYNTLECIRSYAITERNEHIARMAKALADLFRYNTSSKNWITTFQEELNNLNRYMEIMQYRFNDRYQLNLKIEPDTLDINMPKPILQPIVENAIKHGLDFKTHGSITIESYCTDSNFVIVIHDDGVGIALDRLKEINQDLHDTKKFRSNSMAIGMGISNVNSRIKLLYGNSCGLHYSSAPGIGTTVEIILKPEISDEALTHLYPHM